jgi:ribosome-binding factor A
MPGKRSGTTMARQQGPKGPTQRQLRVGEILRHALADMLMRGEIADPELDKQKVTVTEIRLSPDLRNATVYIVPFGGGGDAKAVRSMLAKHQRFLRGELAKRVDLKYMPNLLFQIDETFDEAERIDAILRSPTVSRDLS